MNHQIATQLLATATELLATAQKLLASSNPPARPQPRRRRSQPTPLTESQIAEGFARIRAELAALP